MPVTTAPAAEACQAIVDRINSGSGLTYTLPAAADYVYQISEDIKATTELQVLVIHKQQSTLDETLDVENRTSHNMTIRVRQKLPDNARSTVEALLLIVRQLFQRVNNYATSRVRVWDCDIDIDEGPDESQLREAGLFTMEFPLRVEVEASP